MGTHIKFTPLSVGCGAPICSLLEVDDFVFLLDCGWTESFDTRLLEPLLRQFHRVDAVLFSHPDLAHMGALPYLVGPKCGLAAPIYSTSPVRKMGEMFLWESYHAKMAEEDFTTITLDDFDSAFAHTEWHELRFFQQFALTGKGKGITITPYNAGHSIGGSVWSITKDGQQVVYAVDYCHKKEKLLNSTAIHELFSRPSLMITDTTSVLSAPVNSSTRDREFLSVIHSTIRGGGSVLIPVDTAARVLELALLLDLYWAQNK
ncbi:MAG: hypothetical protein WDW38_000456 [Sanguina aurantia]